MEALAPSVKINLLLSSKEKIVAEYDSQSLNVKVYQELEKTLDKADAPVEEKIREALVKEIMGGTGICMGAREVLQT